jgi:hypothetical protein
VVETLDGVAEALGAAGELAGVGGVVLAPAGVRAATLVPTVVDVLVAVGVAVIGVAEELTALLGTG